MLGHSQLPASCIVLLMTAALSGLCLKPAEAIDCSTVICPKPLCANPTYYKDECCPSCENSNCKFMGCVNYLGGGDVQWAPSSCFICKCNSKQNKKYCAVIKCPRITKQDCYGYPVVTRPYECCPSCDFGTPNIGCYVVPKVFGQVNITVSASYTYKKCTEKVQTKTCDKLGFRYRSRGKTYRCVPREGKKLVDFDDKCPLIAGVYEDTVQCKIVRDESIAVGCDLIVD